MIIRNLAGRHGRKALAAPIRRSWLRALTTETNEPTSTAAADDVVVNASQSSSSTLQDSPSTPFRNPAIPSRKAIVAAAVANDHLTFTRLQRKTAHLGSVVERRYSPGDLLKNPPAPKDVTLELLMASQTHQGHNTALWNPVNSRYIYGVRQGIHIISLEQTASHLRRAARVVEEVAYNGGLILFVGTRKGQMEIVTRAAELAGAYHLFSRWTPGTITNRDQILAAGRVAIVDENDRPLDGFQEHLQDRRPVIPDLVVCLNPLENWTLLHECAQENIPTIGIIDTDADPTQVTYTIPANDDSLRSVAVIAGVLGRGGELGQSRRRQAAKNGVVTWENPEDVSRFISADFTKRSEESNRVMEELKAREKLEEREAMNSLWRSGV
ncbi:putative 37s ribosomal protein mrp4 protein [Phaeoacremonium minimum UCRPA7]|uniref:Putative 37s ribosomal protein mrp4 protein n=1 Tax=Phaeoacremonium minimum (strain UCR-PA7) TaxID=1286976 RepID=R8BDI0_PHAM7|nr:putative 37s ribosomal protein mrp4 protein [Phaeoacremonium minimum UCRPA7]EON97352.1 putative 37s ribosomal protein mrp4 protein [Phaeoacremonium minimum UCRPA7]